MAGDNPKPEFSPENDARIADSMSGAAFGPGVTSGATPQEKAFVAHNPLFSMLPQGEPGSREPLRYPGGIPLGAADSSPAQMNEGTEKGKHFPGRDDLRGADDVAGAMVTYQDKMLTVLETMQRLIMEGIARLEAIEAYFDRLR